MDNRYSRYDSHSISDMTLERILSAKFFLVFLSILLFLSCFFKMCIPHDNTSILCYLFSSLRFAVYLWYYIGRRRRHVKGKIYH